MARKRDSRTPNGAPKSERHAWQTRAAMADILGITPSGFDAGPRRFAGKEDTRKDGRRVLFHAPTIIRRWAESTFGRPPDNGGMDPEDALLLGGPNSPALEELRRIQAKLKDLEWRTKIGELVPRDQIREGLHQIAGRLRAFAEAAQRRFGNEAIDLFDELLTDCESAIERMYGDDDDNDRNSESGA